MGGTPKAGSWTTGLALTGSMRVTSSISLLVPGSSLGVAVGVLRTALSGYMRVTGNTPKTRPSGSSGVELWLWPHICHGGSWHQILCYVRARLAHVLQNPLYAMMCHDHIAYSHVLFLSWTLYLLAYVFGLTTYKALLANSLLHRYPRGIARMGWAPWSMRAITSSFGGYYL